VENYLLKKPCPLKESMPEFKLVVSDPKTGKAKQIEVKGTKAQALIGLNIGDIVDGGLIGMPNVKLMITGGSGISGEPMRADLPGGAKRRLLLSGPPGYHPPKKGMRKRKLVRGNTITEDIVQINMKIVYEEGEHGS